MTKRIMVGTVAVGGGAPVSIQSMLNTSTCDVAGSLRQIEQLKDAGFWVYGADAGGTSATQMRFPEKMALIMGSEGAGISRLLEEHCDVVVSIPTCGRLDSLNVSVATGVLLYEVRRQLPR